MKHEGIRAKQFFHAAGFLALAGILFVLFTYLFREVRRTTRLNLLSYYLEKENSLDVIFVGASSFYRYWDPLHAYGESGVASFVYSCAGLHSSNVKAAVSEAVKTQNPSLLIIDARGLTSEKAEERKENYARYFLDSMDLGLSRFRAVNEHCRLYGYSASEMIPLYLDLCLYHNNYSALRSRLHYELIDNRVSADTKGLFYKGYGMYTAVKRIGQPDVPDTDACTPMSGNGEAVLRDLCGFCSNLDTQVLFLVTPYCLKEGEMEEFNEMARITGEYGFSFINLNHRADYEAMGIDFDTDFYNVHHMNTKGALLFTDYFLTYLLKNYDLPDHREEDAYEGWDEAYKQYLPALEKYMEKIELNIK